MVRQFHAPDAAAMEGVFCDEEVMAFGIGAQTRQWVRDWLSGCLVDYQKLGFGLWAVVEKRRRETIGYCGLAYFADVCGQPEIEIGYRLTRPSWGNGYATEAVLNVRDYAFDTLCIKRLIALIDPGNVRSVRVAEKAGLRYENEVMFEGYDHPDHVYAVTRPQS